MVPGGSICIASARKSHIYTSRELTYGTERRKRKGGLRLWREGTRQNIYLKVAGIKEWREGAVLPMLSSVGIMLLVNQTYMAVILLTKSTSPAQAGPGHR